jgi:hypothetical protein
LQRRKYDVLGRVQPRAFAHPKAKLLFFTTSWSLRLRLVFPLSIIFVIATLTGTPAQTAPLDPQLSGLSFLVGSWTSGAGSGKVAETGGTSRGTSVMAPEVGGAVLLRRDHVDLFSADGKPTGSFDQIMMMYPEGGTVRADYSDGQHIIHYTSATIVAGQSVSFMTSASATAPSFRLSYTKTDARTMAVRFEMAPPGQTAFTPIATGTLYKA